MPNDPCVDAANTALREALEALWIAIIECFDTNPVSQEWQDAHGAAQAKWIEETYPALLAAPASSCGAVMDGYASAVASMKPAEPTSECLEKAWEDFMNRIAEIREQLLDCLGVNP